jgi:cobyrinic acid a,c-diamide synthase
VAYSVAPLLYGFKNFNTVIKLAGVIFNKTGSKSHVQILEEGAKDAGVEMLGYIPRDSRLAIESRHLGLHLPGENTNYEIIDVAASLVEKHVDLNCLLEIIPKTIGSKREKSLRQAVASKLSFAIANDKAFNFAYQANLDALSELGEIKFFSPLEDSRVPNADFIWLPGGYPELFSNELSSNKSMQGSIKTFIEAGKPVVAECGGMMYLGESIIDKNGNLYKMTGVYDFSTSFKNMKLHLGYREIPLNSFSVKGHEFHYSGLIQNNSTPFIPQAKTARGLFINMPVFRYKNCWASYIHLYLGDTRKMLNFLNYLKNNE